jgi:hypothetical protein
MITFTTVENLRWANAEHTSFDCDVFFNHINEKVPFTCHINDNYDHAKKIWDDSIAGEFGPIAEYVDPHTPTESQPVTTGTQTL